MAIIICPVCGAKNSFREGDTVCRCKMCETVLTLTSNDPDRKGTDPVDQSMINEEKTVRDPAYDRNRQERTNLSQNDVDDIRDRNEINRMEGIYQYALVLKNDGRLKEAKSLFESIVDYKDAGEQIGYCAALIETARKEDVYRKALAWKNDGRFTQAKALLESIADYKDAGEQIGYCAVLAGKQRKDGVYSGVVDSARENDVNMQRRVMNRYYNVPGRKGEDARNAAHERKIEEIRAKEKADRMEAERKAEEARVAAEKAAKKRKRVSAIALACAAAAAAFVILLFTVILPSIRYYKAVELYNNGQYKEAIEAFEALNGYKDSDARIKECLLKTDIGSSFFFGSYEQDNDASNGKEEIEWIVLAKDGTSLLLISKYALDCQQYNSSSTIVTWETCSLRKWLNGPFINNAFSSDEQEMIRSTTVTADKNPSYNTSTGNETTDKAFLLSITEAEKYFSSESARQCQATAYAKECHSRTDGKGYCWWWLRSPGRSPQLTAYVDRVGSVDYSGNHMDDGIVAVRPALWIDLGS